jgi:hypothetical protein
MLVTFNIVLELMAHPVESSSSDQKKLPVANKLIFFLAPAPTSTLEFRRRLGGNVLSRFSSKGAKLFRCIKTVAKHDTNVGAGYTRHRFISLSFVTLCIFNQISCYMCLTNSRSSRMRVGVGCMHIYIYCAWQCDCW